MATNPYFRKAVPAEQDLIDDLSIEVIKINGFDMIYLPRTLVREDELLVKTDLLLDLQLDEK